ncbi:MAG: hypothetical protein OXB89_00875 [Anaerolineaceae bacterium]|nr:hypothetical protein [Anaerolineaceae bacterium]
MNENVSQRDEGPAETRSDALWQETPPAVSEGPGAGADLAGPAPRALAPLPGSSRQQTLSLGLFPGAGQRDLLACAWYEAPGELRREFIWLERRDLQQAAGNLLPLVTRIWQDGKAPAPPPWPAEARRECLQSLLQQHDGELTSLLQMLAAALDERGLLLDGEERSTRQRLALVQGLMALLPANGRHLLGFASNVNEISEDAPAILFSDAGLHSTRWRVSDELSLPAQPGGHYLALLAQWWVGDLDRLLAAIDGLGQFPADSDLATGLDQLARQFEFAERIRSGAVPAADDMKFYLKSGLPLPAPLLPEVMHCLLQAALDQRDSEAARLVALQMDADPALDARLETALAAGLPTRPDAVYVFARAQLAAAGDAAPRWRQRLQAAALCSLQIAICEADAATVINWLRLIALEPEHYELSTILHNGLLAARRRAHDDGEIALHLLELAAHHAPDTLEELLADNNLLAALPDNIGLVLRDHAGDPLLTLQRRGPEFFLIAVAQATAARVAGAISSAVLEQLWLLYRGQDRSNLPARFQPEAIVQELLEQGPAWLPASALGNIGALLLADRRDALFLEFAARLAQEDMLAGTLPDAAHRSQRSSVDLVKIFGQLPAASPSQVIVDSNLALLRMRAWSQETLPLAELLARQMQQEEALRIGDESLWQLMEYAGTTRSEMVARSAGRRLFQTRCTSVSEPQLTALLLRLQEVLGWSPFLQTQLTNWWRAWTRTLSMTDLTQLDEILAASRPLLHKREIVQTIIAFRRMLGAENMQEFAARIDSVFELLQHLSLAFDPRNNEPAGFDAETFRTELAASGEEMSQNARAVLAHDLRELAQLIGIMGDRRSHNTLVRPNIERQLLAGEHAPESAVDALKWIAAWLEHSQRAAQNEGESPRTNDED